MYSTMSSANRESFTYFLIWIPFISFSSLTAVTRTSRNMLNNSGIFHRHRVCLVDCVDLIWSFYSWWEGFGSSSLATLPLGFNCGFISTSTWGLSTGVLLLRLPWRAWVCPCEGQVGGGTASWVSGVLAAPGTRVGGGGWWLGQQEIQCSRRVWQQVLDNMFQYSCLETPFSDREAWQATVYRVTKSWTRTKWPCTHSCKAFFFFLACGSSAPVRVECEGGTVVWLAGTLVVPSVQRHRLPLPQELWPYHRFFFASCSWRSEGLFGQYFSVALPIQALRGFPCLGSFSVVWRVRHLEGASWLGSCSVGQCIRHLKEHLGWGPIL